MESSPWKAAADADRTATYADMFAALGAEPRLRILRGAPCCASRWNGGWRDPERTRYCAFHSVAPLEKLKNDITVRRESTFLRYTANTTALEELLGFLYA